MAVSISGRSITVKKSVPPLAVMSAIAGGARAAEGSIDHRDRYLNISLL
jgi:hypothetical protein